MNPAVGLVESYLRPNGYLTVTEYQVQSPVRGQPGKFETATDLDVLGLHLPWAAETVAHHAAWPGKERSEILLATDPVLSVLKLMDKLNIGLAFGPEGGR